MKTSRSNEIKLIFAIVIAFVIFISLLTFNQTDIRFLTSSPNLAKQNVIGSVGAYLAWFFLFLMGQSAYVIPFLIALWGVVCLFEEKPRKFYLRIFGALFLVLAVSSIFSLLGAEELTLRFQKGGIIGLIFSNFLLKYLGTVGTFIAILVFFLLSLIIATDFLIFPFLAWLPRGFKSLIKGASSTLSGMTKIKGTSRKQIFKKETSSPSLRVKAAVQPTVAPLPTPPNKVESLKEKIIGTKKPAEEAAEVKGPKTAVTEKRPYNFPTLDLLKNPPPIEEREIAEDLNTNSRILEETLDDFGIEAKVVGVSKGPVITRYELEPARGVTINRITALSDNIALAMKALSIRVVAPIPGKGTVGVEVPNAKSVFVYLREILESKEYTQKHSKLKLALGKDISGTPIVTDLDDMPHLLIAGATGSGKTVCVNTIITTLLYNASPDELRFLMVDPKKVELAAFNNLPHLLAPVVTDSKKVSHSLDWVVNEMDQRFSLFLEIGVKNIDGYNKKANAENLATLPYIIVIIDELADLMMVAKQEVENMITRLAQLSRAVGIHMIIATQRPSVNVITGVIKANFPARISFKVASKVDSRTVIDRNGAEKLLGKGDMLFLEPGNAKIVRAQGCLVSDEAIADIASFIKAQRKPEYAEDMLKPEKKASYRKFDKDEVYDEAVKLVINTKQASVSMLQRRLGVGYTRAARLIDMMEDERIVGPYQGSKPREILVENTNN
ncbi:MAG: DNA translocase FtsK [Candidatus Omnitrophica bacterium]|nr:DNA translocase FtsK [Candidatus Omnitrophota bacterium]